MVFAISRGEQSQRNNLHLFILTFVLFWFTDCGEQFPLSKENENLEKGGSCGLSTQVYTASSGNNKECRIRESSGSSFCDQKGFKQHGGQLPSKRKQKSYASDDMTCLKLPLHPHNKEILSAVGKFGQWMN